MSQSGKLVMIAALQIKQWVTGLFLYVYIFICWVCKKFLQLHYTLQSETKIQNKRKVKHKTKERFISLLSYANVAVK